MRLSIYVPKRQAELWTPDSTDLTFDNFQQEVIALTGGLTLSSTQSKWPQHGESVFVVETLLHIPDATMYHMAWKLFRSYASQLIAQGEESVLIVQDNEPTFITA